MYISKKSYFNLVQFISDNAKFKGAEEYKQYLKMLKEIEDQNPDCYLDEKVYVTDMDEQFRRNL